MQSETWLNQVLLVFLSIQEGKKEKDALVKFISFNKYDEAFIFFVVAIAHFCSAV